MEPKLPSFPGQLDMATAMQYLPVVLGIVSQVPGVLFGMTFTLLFFLIGVGPHRFGTDIAPVAGFHLLTLFLLREMWETGFQALSRIQQQRMELQQLSSFSSDISMQFKEKLD